MGDEIQIIRIHGTFAQSENDVGDAWWQKSSEFEKKLRNCLPQNFTFSERVFHWSGANLESHRTLAGNHLLFNFLLPNEREGKKYIVVAHSHGGNVVAHAFGMSLVNFYPLNHLIKVITIGTPYLEYRTRWNFTGMVFSGAAVLALLLIASIPLTVGYFVLVYFSADLFSLATLSLLAFQVFWLILIAVVLIVYFKSQVTNSLRDALVAPDFLVDNERGGWTALWSKYDEAIVGLKALSKLTSIFETFTSNATRKLGISETDYKKLIQKQKYSIWNLGETSKLGNFIYWRERLTNAFLAKIAFRFAKGWVSTGLPNLLVGNDVPGIQLLRVSECLDSELDSFPLPKEIDEELLEAAQKITKESGVKLREQITVSADNDPPIQIEDVESLFNGLVHCGYFNNQNVIQLVAELIAEAKIQIREYD